MSFLPAIKFGTFTTTSGPAAVNLDLGFIPDKFEVWEADSTGAEKIHLLYLGSYGTGKGWRQITAGDYTLVTSSFITEYTQTRYVTPSRWTASTVYAVGDVVHPVTYLGSNPAFSYFQAGTQFYYQCTTAGTSHTSEPTWGVTLAGTTSEGGGTVVWTAIAFGGTGTSFTPATLSVQAKGVTIPAAELKASTAYHYEAIKAVT